MDPTGATPADGPCIAQHGLFLPSFGPAEHAANGAIE